MTSSRRDLLATALASVLASGCGTSPPGAGFTSGDKATFTTDEKPGVRDDLQMPTNPDSGDASLAESAANIPDTGGNPPASKAKAKAKANSGQSDESRQPSESPSATPSNK